MKFNLNTAFRATSKGITAKSKAFEDKENEYKRQIEELTKKAGKKKEEKTGNTDIPDEWKEKFARLEKLENDASKAEKFKEVLSIAKKSVRSDLHKSLENYANDFGIDADADVEEQAKKLTLRFSEIFKDSIGDVKPLAPKQTAKRDEEFLNSIPKMKV